ncbi:MAG: serine/threonine protein kinase [Proteobacteria bacterium]|nr:serine/threonine protein kinase [Pseudomonadota bacterium]
MILKIGSTLERYTIEKYLGKGGMAEVYRIMHNHLGTRFALKVLVVESERVRQRLIQEGRIQSRLRHPNVVAVTDVIQVDGMWGLIMEYVEGPTLAHLLRTHRLTINEIQELGEGIISGVAAAHQIGVIHRDLKPANIMCEISGNQIVPKVLDFGLVKFLAPDPDCDDEPLTQQGIAIGTPLYMAPEQISDTSTVTTAADIFSLGVILYEIIAGDRPFRGADTHEIFARVLSGRYPPLDKVRHNVPPNMKRAIEGCLHKTPAARFPDCQTLLDVWHGGIRHQPKNVWRSDVIDYLNQATPRYATRNTPHTPHPTSLSQSIADSPTLIVDRRPRTKTILALVTIAVGLVFSLFLLVKVMQLAMPSPPVLPATFNIDGDAREAWLLTEIGVRVEPGELTSGSYQLRVRFDETDKHPVDMGIIKLEPNENRTIRCMKALRTCID